MPRCGRDDSAGCRERRSRRPDSVSAAAQLRRVCSLPELLAELDVSQVAPAMSKRDVTAPRLKPSLVGGFSVPDNLRYHPGHTWALSESPNLVRIGVDDFAAKLVGKIEHITLPQRGQWIRQGQKVWSIVRNGV